jgi:hypothetical protein
MPKPREITILEVAPAAVSSALPGERADLHTPTLPTVPASPSKWSHCKLPEAALPGPEAFNRVMASAQSGELGSSELPESQIT